MKYQKLCIFIMLLPWLIVAPALAEVVSAFKLTKVQFKGLNRVDRKTLAKTLSANPPSRFKFWLPKPVLTEDDLSDDVRKIKQYYQAYGFFDVKVKFSLDRLKALDAGTLQKGDRGTDPSILSDLTPSHSAEVIFSISEGAPVLVEAIDIQIKNSPAVFSGFDFFKHLPLKKNTPFKIADYKESKISLQKLFGNKGYPFATVTSKAVVKKETHTAAISYGIDPGVSCTFGPLEISEESLPVNKAIIERAVTFKTGELYEMRKVEQSQRNLYNLDVFKSALIRMEHPNPKEFVVPTSLALKLKKRQNVKFGVGYGSEDGVRLKGGWTYRNLAGWAGLFTLAAKHSDLYEGVTAAYTQPYFWDSHTSLTGGIGTEKEMLDSYDSLHTYGNVNLTRKWGPYWESFGGYRLEMSRIEDLNLTDPEELIEFKRENDFLISSCLVGAVRNNTDSDINPTKGYVLSMMLEAASGVFGSDISFLSPELEIKTYLSVPFQIILACRLRAESILEIEDTDRIPIFKRLFLGGSNTVRGYRYQNLGPLDDNGNPLGGQTALNANVELRRRLFKSVSGVLFLDLGSLTEDAFDYDLGDMLFAGGAGVRYDTPVGPIRIDVGYKLNPETSVEDRWRIHFSIGHAF